jgi:hypothetical protein
MFTEVVHRDQKDDSYHADQAWSVSQWKLLPDHPEEFHGYHVVKPPRWEREITPALAFGTMVHARLLEPDTFSEKCPEAGACAGVLKTGKNAGQSCGNCATMRDTSGNWWCGVHGKGTGAQSIDCLSSTDALRLDSIVRGVHANPKVCGCLSAPGQTEYALFGTHAETGLKVRGRLDRWYELGGGRIIVDLKTCAHDPCNERLVAATCLQRGYHCQCAAYLDMMEGAGLRCDGFVFIFIRTSPPYNSCLWLLNENAVDLGQRRNRLSLLNLADRLKTGDWMGPRNGQENYLSFPAWALEDNTHIAEANAEAFSEFAAFAN